MGRSRGAPIHLDGRRADAPGFAPSSGSAVEFSDTGFVFSQSAGSVKDYLTSTASAIADGRFRLELTDPDGSDGCRAGDVGLYGWEQSPSGRITTITAESDACTSRLEALGRLVAPGVQEP